MLGSLGSCSRGADLWKTASEHYTPERVARMKEQAVNVLNTNKGNWTTAAELADHLMHNIFFIGGVGGHFDMERGADGKFLTIAHYMLKTIPRPGKNTPFGVTFDIPIEDQPFLEDGKCNPEFIQQLVDAIPVYLEEHKKLNQFINDVVNKNLQQCARDGSPQAPAP